jgi:hypothetical protein
MSQLFILRGKFKMVEEIKVNVIKVEENNESLAEVFKFILSDNSVTDIHLEGDGIKIRKWHSELIEVKYGEYIIKGVAGECLPCTDSMYKTLFTDRNTKTEVLVLAAREHFKKERDKYCKDAICILQYVLYNKDIYEKIINNTSCLISDIDSAINFTMGYLKKYKG